MRGTASTTGCHPEAFISQMCNCGTGRDVRNDVI